MSKRRTFKRSLERAAKPLLGKSISSTRHSGKPVSWRTRKARLDQIRALADAIYDAGYRPQRAENLRIKHMDALVASWRERGIKKSVARNNISMLKPLTLALKRPELEDYLREAVEATIPPDDPRQDSLSWSSRGIDVKAAIDRVFERDSLVALQLLLQRHFGLRVRESHRLRPSESWREGSDTLEILRGTKGGMPRTVPVRSETDRELLRHARAVARDQGGSMMPREYQETSWRSHYYGVLKDCGITRRELGVTSHGLRHEYAQTLYEDESGLPAPVLAGGASTAHGAEGDADLEGRRAVCSALGHSRYDITRHYLDRIDATGKLRHCTMRAPRGQGRIRKLAKDLARRGGLKPRKKRGGGGRGGKGE